MKKKVLSILLAVCLLVGALPLPASAAGNRFEDVSSSDYYSDAVAWAVENGVTSGTSSTTFSPNQSCTRAQAVTFLWRAAGEPEPSGSSNPFWDVSPSQYYYKAVLWAVGNSVTSGTSSTTFSPNQKCSRAQIATFLWRAARKPLPEMDSGFSDVPSDQYYATAVAWAVENGITTGTSNKKFSPDVTCSRAQIVTFLYRFSKSQNGGSSDSEDKPEKPATTKEERIQNVIQYIVQNGTIGTEGNIYVQLDLSPSDGEGATINYDRNANRVWFAYSIENETGMTCVFAEYDLSIGAVTYMHSLVLFGAQDYSRLAAHVKVSMIADDTEEFNYVPECNYTAYGLSYLQNLSNLATRLALMRWELLLEALDSSLQDFGFSSYPVFGYGDYPLK